MISRESQQARPLVLPNASHAAGRSEESKFRKWKVIDTTQSNCRPFVNALGIEPKCMLASGTDLDALVALERLFAGGVMKA
jgi:hypothetical protein